MQTTELTHREEVAEGTMSFQFSKPEGFTFIAGQTMDITLMHPPETDAEGNSRTFSIAASPHEDHLMITTRIRNSAFKRVLKDMPEGTPVSVDGPFGSFVLHENIQRPAVFLGGGIGVTPFRSIVLDATHRNLPHTLILFLSNRKPEDTVFLDDFHACEQKNKKFTCVPTMTDMAHSLQEWKGETGYINEPMLKKYIPSPSEPIYYLAGPQPMVYAMRQLLQGMGISNDDIRYEEFAGY